MPVSWARSWEQLPDEIIVETLAESQAVEIEGTDFPLQGKSVEACRQTGADQS